MGRAARADFEARTLSMAKLEMTTYPIPVNEAERLAALRALNVVGSGPEPHFDAICAIAAAFFDVPTALVSLVEEEFQWFKARCGAGPATTTRDVSICTHAILSDDLFVIEDTLADPRFASNPDCTAEDGIRFYAGAPLVLRPGIRLGTFCIIDNEPRVFTAAERVKLREFAHVVMAHLRLHQANRDAERERSKAKDARDLLSLSLDAAGAGLWSVDLKDGKVVLNAESGRIHGLVGSLETDMAGWRALVDAEDGVKAEALAVAAAANGSPYSAEFKVPQPDGSVRWVQGIGRVQYDRSGAKTKMVGLNLDITERKASEAALLRANAEAQAAREAAESANRAKSDFLASMSHEIRTPLSSIVGFTGLMLDNPALAGELRRQAEVVQSSGAALLTVINDILDFSKVEAGKIEIESVPFAPRALIANALSIVRGLALAKNLDIVATIDPALPESLLGDQARLQQVLLNLLNNAVKFTSHGSVTLDVRVEGEAGASTRLRFSVVDTGVGIDVTKQDRLFERFSQADASVSRRFGGTGLGLAISKSLVELMHGEIGVDSEEGRGACFWFTLALPRAGAADGACPSATPAGPAIGRLLLVEDIEVNRLLARTILEADGHVVDVAESGEAAIEAVLAKPYDLVLMDVQMPGMGGIAATQAIRALPGLSRLPIVAMTANVMTEQVVEFRAAGMDDHVGKPINRKQLRAVLERWLRTPERAGIAAA